MKYSFYINYTIGNIPSLSADNMAHLLDASLERVWNRKRNEAAANLLHFSRTKGITVITALTLKALTLSAIVKCLRGSFTLVLLS